MQRATRATCLEPFPGARPYEEEHRDFFFGRKQEANEVTQRILRERITILTGDSASGKTSLVRAGIIPRLRHLRSLSDPKEGNSSEGHAGQPRVSPALVLRDWGGGKGPSADVLIRMQLPDAIGSLAEWSAKDYHLLLGRYEKLENMNNVASVASGLADAAGGLILILDQFEEVLRASKSLAEELVGILRRLYQSVPCVRVLLSLREEYHKDLRDLESVVGPLYARTYFLKQMAAPTVEQAIRSAAKAAKINLSEAVIGTLIGWLAEESPVQSGLASGGAEVKPPDLLRIQTVMRELYDLRRDANCGDGRLSIDDQVLRQYTNGRPAKDIVGRALERWISDALKTPAPLRGSSSQISEPVQKGLVMRIAARLAPLLSSGGYKVAQEEADLFRSGLREDLASLLGLEDRNLPKQIADAVRETGNLFLSSLSLGHAMTERAGANLAGAAKQWSVDVALQELYLNFQETLQRLRRKNIVKRLHIGDRVVWELVHDGFGKPFWTWAEENRETWEDCLSSLVACRGVSPILIKDSLDSHDVIRDLNWLGCLVKPETQEISLNGLYFENCNLRGTIFEDCTFLGVTFHQCLLDGTVFRNCRFFGTRDDGVQFKDCYANSLGFLGCKVAILRFDNCTLRQPTFANLILTGPLCFTNSTLHSAFFECLRARIEGKILFEGNSRLLYSSWDSSFEGLIGEDLEEFVLQSSTSGLFELTTGEAQEAHEREIGPIVRRNTLLETLRDTSEARRRVIAGTDLDAIGDPRPEVMTVDGMELCWVPPGPFWMGSEEQGESDYPREHPLHECDLTYNFWMGRYPITVAQFGEFVAETRCQLGNLESLFGQGNEPVAWISWYEGMAFCGWLTDKWRRSGLLVDGWEVRLPSEAEWEKAARGGLTIPSCPIIRSAENLLQGIELKVNPQPMRSYPWGEQPDPNRANYRATGIGNRNAVGCFAFGESPYGCEEMSGNMWEWTRSLWGEDFQESSFPYPYVASDGREDQTASSQVRRVLRGGAFDDDSTRVRCSFRIRYLPGERKSGIGLRVVVLRTA